MTAERLNALVEAIQQLNATEYEELFKLLYENKCEYTQNNNGIFLNLSWLPEAMISKLELFIKFCKASRREIQHYETLCKNLSQAIPSKACAGAGAGAGAGDSDAMTGTGVGAGGTGATGSLGAHAGPGAALGRNGSSSSMKFYLLKKKYAKMGTFDPLQNDLEKECVVL